LALSEPVSKVRRQQPSREGDLAGETVQKAEEAVEKIVDEFGRQRSHEASKIAYDMYKTTAQSCLVINGGAAAAVLALLAKDHVDAAIIKNVPWALGGYAVGIALSAVMLFCIMMMADYWNYSWFHSTRRTMTTRREPQRLPVDGSGVSMSYFARP
jgi:hypothetical protein